MNTIGFPISSKKNELRRAIVPQCVAKVLDPSCLIIEKGYGKVLGYSDADYLSEGARVEDRETVLGSDVIVDLKVGDGDYLLRLPYETILFGWVHAAQNPVVTNALVARKLTAYAWENMNFGGRHVFWRNNELAGEAAVMHAFQCYGKMPYETKTAVIGRGNTAHGAARILNMLGAEIVFYDRGTEALLRDEIADYDVIVNCVKWDRGGHDHILSFSDLAKMKRDSMIVDVSCDRAGAIESSVPTTIQSPVYEKNGVLHYAVDHTPSLFHKTFSRETSSIICEYVNQFLRGTYSSELEDSLIIDKGTIVDTSITDFQAR